MSIITNDITEYLYQHNTLFFTFLNDMVEPVFDSEIPTAAVWFDDSGTNFKFAVNPDFWDSLNIFSRIFVVSHEIMHVFLKHGIRGKKFLETQDKKSFKLLNISQDISLNELLFKYFDFTHDVLNFDFDMCLVDTCFEQETINKYNISKEESFDYYYKLIVDNPELKIKKSFDSMDTHTFNESVGKGHQKGDEVKNDFSDEDDEMSALKDFFENNGFELPDEESNEEYDNYGFSGSSSEKSFDFEKKIRGLSDYFNIAIKTSVYYKQKNTEKSVWHGYNRRLSPILQSIDPKLSIPSTMTSKKLINDKHHLLIYIDTSYSCQAFFNIFSNCVVKLPLTKFSYDLFSFSDDIHYIDTTNIKEKGLQINGFSGTNIKALVSHSKEYLNNNKVDGIFVLTDGLFWDISNSFIKKDKKWHWFLVPFNNQYCFKNIPSTNAIYYLPDINNF